MLEHGPQLTLDMGVDKAGAAVVAGGIADTGDLVEVVPDPLQFVNDRRIGGAEALDQDVAV